MIPAAAYLRVSSGMQVETGASLPSQLAEIRAYCNKNGLELLEEHIYTDAGESARTDDRPAFQEMISAARQTPPPFGAIVCWENSRFARSREDAVTYKALLKRCGVDLRFVKQDFENSPMGTFMEGIVELVDEWYSKNLAIETRRGLIENARQGYSGGGTPPYGLRRVTVMNEFGKEKATREPDPGPASIVREIFEMRAEKKMGYRAIAYALNDRGIRSPKGGDWSANTIYYMLTKNQPAYLGHLIFNRADYSTPGQKDKPEDEWVVVENAWTAIVTQELVDSVNALIPRGRGTVTGSRKKEHDAPFVLSGKIICGLCGGSVSGVTSGISPNLKNANRT
jgi:DNA invertase Pin-like site-specific DNA recombinase